MTASSWIVNRSRTKILLVYHNIYQSWSWTGGHADGDSDLMAVSIREAREETGLQNIRALSEEIFSLENLCVNGHVKRGKYVSSHLHANVTYLLEADDREKLAINQDENSGVAWFPIGEVLQAPSEDWMVEIVYRKLQEKLHTFTR
jgi:ADP-ribose pyrophosphatase YjhB (NUDIX family)